MLRIGDGDWLPAIEVYGEGVFFEFDAETLKVWASKDKVDERIKRLNRAYHASKFGKNAEETSPHEFNEATFAKHIADDLYHKVHKGGIEAIVLVADQQTLGQIRPSLHKEVLNLISGELDKDLTNSSITDIENSLTKAGL